METMDELKIFDRAKMLENIEGDLDLLKTLCGQFLSTHGAVLDNIRLAVTNKDPASLAASAHKLKGSCANFFAERARAASFTLEQYGKSASFENADPALKELESEVRSLVSVLEKEIKGEATLENSGPDAHGPAAASGQTGVPKEKEPGLVCDLRRMEKDLNGDRKLLKEIGGTFLNTCAHNIEEIRNAARAKNSALIIDKANTFKGAVSAFYAERVIAVIEETVRRGKQENLEGIETVINELENELKALNDALRAAVSLETTESQDVVIKKKADVLDLVGELRISVETTYALKNAIQNRMNDLESRLQKSDDEIVKLGEELKLFRESLKSPETLQAAPSQEMVEIVTEMTDKISEIEREFLGEKKGMELTRNDLAGIIGILKQFRKIFYALIIRFGSHMAQYHQQKDQSVEKGDWVIKKYNYTKL